MTTPKTCSGCGGAVPRKRYPSGKLYQPRICSEECAKLVAVRSGRKGGKITAPKYPHHIDCRADEGGL